MHPGSYGCIPDAHPVQCAPTVEEEGFHAVSGDAPEGPHWKSNAFSIRACEHVGFMSLHEARAGSFLFGGSVRRSLRRSVRRPRPARPTTLFLFLFLFLFLSLFLFVLPSLHPRPTSRRRIRPATISPGRIRRAPPVWRIRLVRHQGCDAASECQSRRSRRSTCRSKRRSTPSSPKRCCAAPPDRDTPRDASA